MPEIPDPERQPELTNIRHALLPEETTNSFRIGQHHIDPERHDGFRVNSEEGLSHEVKELQNSSDDPDEVVGTLAQYFGDELVGGPKRVRFKRYIRESRSFTFVEEHSKSSTATAIVTGVVVVGSLVILRRRRNRE